MYSAEILATGREALEQQLGNFAGTLLSDGCAAYNTCARSRAGVTRARGRVFGTLDR